MTQPADNCPICHEPVLAECGGQGHTRTDELTVRPCNRIIARQIRAHLGTEISSVRFVRSPLFVENDKGEVVTDLTTQNLWIKTKWPGFLPHLKWTLGRKGNMFLFRIVTDLRIKSVFCGDEQYKSRPASMREDTQVYNNLEDLIGKDVDLAIIKLGYLGYKNKAAAGALKEALLLRDACLKPTWIIEDERAEHAWIHSRSPEVEDYVSRFDEITIDPVPGITGSDEPKRVQEPRQGNGIRFDDDDDTPVIPATQLTKAKPNPKPESREPEVEPERTPSSSLDSFLDGNKSKGFGNKFKKKGGSW